MTMGAELDAATKEAPPLYNPETRLVECADCGHKTDESRMLGDYTQGEDGDEAWSNHICPVCGFWNDTPKIWREMKAAKHGQTD